MLTHVLVCLNYLGNREAEFICIDSFPGIEPYHGLGQLRPEQLASAYNELQTVTHDQFLFADHVDRAFALQDGRLLSD